MRPFFYIWRKFNHMAAKKKFYVVWQGNKTGVFDSWDECKEQVQGVAGAKYKSFTSREMAEDAYHRNYEEFAGKDTKKTQLSAEEKKKYGSPIDNSLSVDAACNMVTGEMEYQGVYTATSSPIFHQGPFDGGTNNVGEFLALVHGLAYLKQQKLEIPIYSDSRTAISWIKKKKCNSKLEPTAKNKILFDMIARAEKWLKENSWKTTILKWETKAWGEIPADFGRK